MVVIQENDNQKSHQYWVVRLGRGGSYVNLLKEKNQIAIGWEDLGDLSWLFEDEKHPGESRKKLFNQSIPDDNDDQSVRYYTTFKNLIEC